MRNNFGKTDLNTLSAIHNWIVCRHRNIKAYRHGNSGSWASKQSWLEPNYKGYGQIWVVTRAETPAIFEGCRPSGVVGRTTGSWCQYLVRTRGYFVTIHLPHKKTQNLVLPGMAGHVVTMSLNSATRSA